MGEEHYRQKIIEALKSGNDREAGLICVDWQINHDITNKPLFFLTKAIIHSRNGKTAGCKQCKGSLDNLLRILE